jgi:hypothetical protein
MGVISCAGCSDTVNDQAVACPNCGANPRTGVVPDRVLAHGKASEGAAKVVVQKQVSTRPGLAGLVVAIMGLVGPVAAVFVVTFLVIWVDVGSFHAIVAVVGGLAVLATCALGPIGLKMSIASRRQAKSAGLSVGLSVAGIILGALITFLDVVFVIGLVKGFFTGISS